MRINKPPYLLVASSKPTNTTHIKTPDHNRVFAFSDIDIAHAATIIIIMKS